MKHLRGFVCALCVVGSLVAATTALADLEADRQATVVVFNEKDPVSTELAGTYAEARRIPMDHLVGIPCSLEETISREEYDSHIAGPLRKIFADRGWWKVDDTGKQKKVTSSSIQFVVLMKGVPLRIAGMANYPGDRILPGNPQIVQHNEAAVDSELATLGLFTHQISGAIDNPFFRSYSTVSEAALTPLLLVCRLDGPDANTVRQMIGSAINTELQGLKGFAYIDSRHEFAGPVGKGDTWFRRIADDLAKRGIPFDFDDNPEVFANSYPMRNAALYFGWYSGDVIGPFKDDWFRFNQGAIAVHIFSYSAETLRDPQKWCAALLKHGAAATLGNVYEPYLHLTPNLDIFEERLLNGFSFAEAAYASEPVLSWMTTFIGDPLYRPFAKREAEPTASSGPENQEWNAYQNAVKLWFGKDRSTGEKALRLAGDQLKSGFLYEALGALQAWSDDKDAALLSWDKAYRLYTNADDRNRCALHVINVFRKAGRNKDVLAIVRKQLQSKARANSAPCLAAIQAQLAPPSPSTTKPKH